MISNLHETANKVSNKKSVVIEKPIYKESPNSKHEVSEASVKDHSKIERFAETIKRGRTLFNSKIRRKSKTSSCAPTRDNVPVDRVLTTPSSPCSVDRMKKTKLSSIRKFLQEKLNNVRSFSVDRSKCEKKRKNKQYAERLIELLNPSVLTQLNQIINSPNMDTIKMILPYLMSDKYDAEKLDKLIKLISMHHVAACENKNKEETLQHRQSISNGNNNHNNNEFYLLNANLFLKDDETNNSTITTTFKNESLIKSDVCCDATDVSFSECVTSENTNASKQRRLLNKNDQNNQFNSISISKEDKLKSIDHQNKNESKERLLLKATTSTHRENDNNEKSRNVGCTNKSVKQDINTNVRSKVAKTNKYWSAVYLNAESEASCDNGPTAIDCTKHNSHYNLSPNKQNISVYNQQNLNVNKNYEIRPKIVNHESLNSKSKSFIHRNPDLMQSIKRHNSNTGCVLPSKPTTSNNQFNLLLKIADEKIQKNMHLESSNSKEHLYAQNLIQCASNSSQNSLKKHRSKTDNSNGVKKLRSKTNSTNRFSVVQTTSNISNTEFDADESSRREDDDYTKLCGYKAYLCESYKEKMRKLHEVDQFVSSIADTSNRNSFFGNVIAGIDITKYPHVQEEPFNSNLLCNLTNSTETFHSAKTSDESLSSSNPDGSNTRNSQLVNRTFEQVSYRSEENQILNDNKFVKKDSNTKLEICNNDKKFTDTEAESTFDISKSQNEANDSLNLYENIKTFSYEDQSNNIFSRKESFINSNHSLKNSKSSLKIDKKRSNENSCLRNNENFKNFDENTKNPQVGVSGHPSHLKIDDNDEIEIINSMNLIKVENTEHEIYKKFNEIQIVHIDDTTNTMLSSLSSTTSISNSNHSIEMKPSTGIRDTFGESVNDNYLNCLNLSQSSESSETTEVTDNTNVESEKSKYCKTNPSVSTVNESTREHQSLPLFEPVRKLNMTKSFEKLIYSQLKGNKKCTKHLISVLNPNHFEDINENSSKSQISTKNEVEKAKDERDGEMFKNKEGSKWNLNKNRDSIESTLNGIDNTIEAFDANQMKSSTEVKYDSTSINQEIVDIFNGDVGSRVYSVCSNSSCLMMSETKTKDENNELNNAIERIKKEYKLERISKKLPSNLEECNYEQLCTEKSILEQILFQIDWDFSWNNSLEKNEKYFSIKKRYEIVRALLEGLKCKNCGNQVYLMQNKID